MEDYQKLILYTSSDLILHHLSFLPNLPKKVLPKIPDGIDPKINHNCEYPEPLTERICFSSTIEGCFRALYPNVCHFFEKHHYPYIDIFQYQAIFKGGERYLPPEVLTSLRFVWDAHITKEYWVLDPVKIKKVAHLRFKNPGKNITQLKTRPFNDPKKPKRNYVGPKNIHYINLERGGRSLENTSLSIQW